VKRFLLWLVLALVSGGVIGYLVTLVIGTVAGVVAAVTVFHALRHSAVGLMVEAGAHPEAFKARLGHASIRTTSDVYGHVLPSVDTGISAALEERFGTGMVQEERRPI
jgi:integrase